MATSTWRFEALDTLFFRESRPFDAIGGTELVSRFPPPPRTIAGAIRSVIGEALGADWSAFHRDPAGYAVQGKRLRDLIGFGDDMADLSFAGPWITLGGERIYPIQYCIVWADAQGRLGRMRIGAHPARCHLGNVRLPEPPTGHDHYRALEQTWLTRAGLEAVLSGSLPRLDDIRSQGDLFAEEPRLGIGRNNSARTTVDGLLYQTRHLRLQPEVGIEMDVDGVSERTGYADRLVRLGGEGRLAHLTVLKETPPFPVKPTPTNATLGLVLMLLTPARFDEGAWYPPGFEVDESTGVTCWRGEIKGVAVTIQAAAIGKALREGGWDQAANQGKGAPRAVQSLLPAGSVFYCTVAGDLSAAIDALHGAQIGHDQALGRGRLACGLWPQHEYLGDTI